MNVLRTFLNVYLKLLVILKKLLVIVKQVKRPTEVRRRRTEMRRHDTEVPCLHLRLPYAPKTVPSFTPAFSYTASSSKVSGSCSISPKAIHVPTSYPIFFG